MKKLMISGLFILSICLYFLINRPSSPNVDSLPSENIQTPPIEQRRPQHPTETKIASPSSSKVDHKTLAEEKRNEPEETSSNEKEIFDDYSIKNSTFEDFKDNIKKTFTSPLIKEAVENFKNSEKINNKNPTLHKIYGLFIGEWFSKDNGEGKVELKVEPKENSFIFTFYDGDNPNPIDQYTMKGSDYSYLRQSSKDQEALILSSPQGIPDSFIRLHPLGDTIVGHVFEKGQFIKGLRLIRN